MRRVWAGAVLLLLLAAPAMAHVDKATGASQPRLGQGKTLEIEASPLGGNIVREALGYESTVSSLGYGKHDFICAGAGGQSKPEMLPRGG
jgi:hypothetical protein